MSKILVDRGSSVNILYEHALDQMEDTPELAQKIILPSLLYGLNTSKGTLVRNSHVPRPSGSIQCYHKVLHS